MHDYEWLQLHMLQKPRLEERKWIMKKGICIICLALSFLIIFAAQAMAQEGKIHVGKLMVTPGIAVQGVHDDNIYLSSGRAGDPELSDWIMHVMPELALRYSLPERGDLIMGYQGDLAYYSDYDDNDWQTHKAFFGLNYQAPAGLILGINNTYTDAEDPFGSDNQYNLGVPNTERWNNDLKTNIGYMFGERFKVFAMYNYYKQDYDLEDDFTQDYDYSEFGIGFQMRVLPKTWGFVRYHFGKKDYFTHRLGVTDQNDADFDSQRVNVGLTWDVGANVSGELNFGYQWKDYDNELDPNNQRYDDKDTWIAGTALTYTPGATTTLIISLTRALRDTGSDTTEYFEDTSVGVSLTQKYYEKFSLNLFGEYAKNDFNLPVANPKDETDFIASIGMDYLIQDWLRTGVRYTYKEKDSNYAEDEFRDNQLILTLGARY